MAADSDGHILHNLMLFGEVLRRLGLDFGSGNMLDLVRATQDVTIDINIGRKQDFQQAARCLLVHRKQDLPLFDDAFKVFWRPPAHGISTRELRSMGEERRYRTPRVGPAGAGANDAEGGAPDPARPPVVDLTRTYSAQEVLRARDFAEYSPVEMSQARVLMSQLSWNPGRRRTRRLSAGGGARLDLRRSFRDSLKYGGELLDLAHLQPKHKPRSLVLICDVSGSMERYTRMLLHFTHTIAGDLGRVEAFLFATRLTRITRHLRYRNIDQAVTEVSRAVPDWAGGTRIGETLKTFNYQWARRVLRSGSVVLIISDGWDRGEPELLSQEMARLQRSCHRLIWLNPLLGSPEYQPLTRGMQAALPYIDDFLPVHNLDSLESLARHLSQLRPHRGLSIGRRRAGGADPEPPPAAGPGTRREINPALASTFRNPMGGRVSPQ
ncbi:MAG TPA: VWA domain-containing protein [Dehalococcoidia bacterium]|nr:VWA domain-containing protein [Dehalococcoidia bacterium]